MRALALAGLAAVLVGCGSESAPAPSASASAPVVPASAMLPVVATSATAVVPIEPPRTPAPRLAFEWLRPKPFGWDLTDVTSTKTGSFVAVSALGVVVKSEDGGTTWTDLGRKANTMLLSITSLDSGRLVAVGADGTIVVSDDGGATFEPRASGTDIELADVWAHENLVVAVGRAGLVVRSEDGAQTWAAYESPVQGNLRSVWGRTKKEIFVASTHSYGRSTDGGKTFESLEGTMPAPGSYSRLARVTTDEQGRLFVFGQDGTFMRAGADQKLVVSNVKDKKRWEAFGDVVEGASGELLLASDQGLVALLADGTFEARPLPEKRKLNALARRAEVVVAVGDDGAVARSADGGKTWEAGWTGPKPTALNAVFTVGKNIYAAGDHGLVVASKDGGATWEILETKTDEPLYGIGGSEKDLVVVGRKGTLLRSKDGGAFEAEKSGVTNPLRAVWASASGDTFVVGDAGTILHRKGDDPWKPQTSGTNQWLTDVWGRSDKDVFVAGWSGIIMHSADAGATWKKLDSGMSDNLDGIFGTDKLVYAVGRYGRVVRSEDDATFAIIESVSRKDLHGVFVTSGSAVLGAGAEVVVGADDGTFEKYGNLGETITAVAPDDAGGAVMVGSDGAVVRVRIAP